MHIRTALFTLLAFTPACAPRADTAQPEPAPAPAPAPVAKPARPIPDGFYALTPQLVVKGVDEAVDFYVKAFAASKVFTLPGPDGKTLHAEIKIGDSVVMIDEEMEGSKSPLTLGGTPALLMLYVPSADATWTAATGAGAKIEKPLEDQFWGDRYGELTDPFGHRWAVSTHIEDLSSEQTQQRAALMYAPADKKGKKAKPAKKARTPAEPSWKQIAGTPAKAPVPAGYHTVTLAIVVPRAAETIDFYKAALGAIETDRMAGEDGRIMHAELELGDSKLMLSDEYPEMGGKSALTLGGSPVSLHHYTTDADAAFAKLVGAGGKPAMPLADVFWGDRYGAVVDPAGFTWGVATHKVDLTPEQMAERMKAEMAKPTT